MKWYYKNDQGMVGPLSHEAIKELHSCGVVKGETQVREEGTESWAPYHEALSKVPVKQPTPVPIAEQLIKFYCPFCHAKLAARLEDSGGSLDCPSCKAELVVPTGFAQTKQPLRAQNPPSSPIPPPAPLVPPTPATPPLVLKAQPATAPGPKTLLVGKTAAEQAKPVLATPASVKSNTPTPVPAPATPFTPVGTASTPVAEKTAAEPAKPNPKVYLIKGRIENAKQFALPKAQYALGRKLYEARLLLGMKDEIEEIESLMAEAEEQQAEAQEASPASALPFGKKNTASNTYEALFQKLKEALTRLGGLGPKATEITSLPDYMDDVAAITSIEAEIEKLEEEMKNV